MLFPVIKVAILPRWPGRKFFSVAEQEFSPVAIQGSRVCKRDLDEENDSCSVDSGVEKDQYHTRRLKDTLSWIHRAS